MNPLVNLQRARRLRGLSLIELMIAMTLGLVTIAAVGWIYLGTTKTYRTQDALARLQEGARFAFEIIGNDLRMTGTTGCSSKHGSNVVTNHTSDWWKDLLDQPLIAEDKDTSGDFPMSDGLRVLHADISKEYLVQDHTGTTFTLKSAAGLKPGSILVATDCLHVAVLAASGVTETEVTYGSPQNESTNLGQEGSEYHYSAATGSRLYPLSANTYYVANNPANQPALFRDRLLSDGTVVAEELVEGVEDLQVSFTVDDDGNGVPDFPAAGTDPYLTPDAIKAGTGVTGSTSEKWAKVMSVRISLVMRTVQDNVIDKSNGTDRRLRKVFTHVIKMRNQW